MSWLGGTTRWNTAPVAGTARQDPLPLTHIPAPTAPRGTRPGDPECPRLPGPVTYCRTGRESDLSLPPGETGEWGA